jgi:hypothetical protein
MASCKLNFDLTVIRRALLLASAQLRRHLA